MPSSRYSLKHAVKPLFARHLKSRVGFARRVLKARIDKLQMRYDSLYTLHLAHKRHK